MNQRETMTLSALLLLAGCLAPARSLTTIWPPDDFFFEVRHSVITDDGLQERQQVQFHRDGLVFFREASTFIDAAADEPPLPVFGRACRYQMRPDSVRQLSRLLSRAVQVSARRAGNGVSGVDKQVDSSLAISLRERALPLVKIPATSCAGVKLMRTGVRSCQ